LNITLYNKLCPQHTPSWFDERKGLRHDRESQERYDSHGWEKYIYSTEV